MPTIIRITPLSRRVVWLSLVNFSKIYTKTATITISTASAILSKEIWSNAELKKFANTELPPFLPAKTADKIIFNMPYPNTPYV